MVDLPTGAEWLRLVSVLLVGGAIGYFGQRGRRRSRRDRTDPQELLRVSQAQLAGILTIAADAIITVDSSHAIVDFNSGAEEIFGYRADELIGRPLDLLLPRSALGVHRGHVARFAESTENARRMGARREVAGRRRDGSEFPAEASISKLPTPTGMLFCVVLRDATEAKRREQHEHLLAVAGARLAASLEYEATLRVVAELVVPSLGDWSILDVIEHEIGEERTLRRVASTHHDPARHRLLREIESAGLDWDSPSAVIDVLRAGEPLLLKTVSDDWSEAHAESPEAVERGAALGLASLLMVPLLARDEVFGALTIGRSAGRSPFDENDLALARAIGFRAALAIDNAVRYRAEQRATMARNEILAIVSHDLRNPANAISLCARALREHPPESTREREALMETIAESAEWMRRLMQDLVDVASIEAGRLSITPEPQEVAPIIAAVLELFQGRAAQGNHVLTSAVPPSLPAVDVDRSRIMQVLANLLDNAIKFTPQGGAIHLTATAGEEEVVLSVQDNGPGVPREYLPHLFDRFWHARGTSHTHGSGLGLAIARGIITAHGGRIWVDTSVTDGAAFRFSVPVAE